MPLNPRIFLALYVLFGAGMTAVTKFQPLSGKIVADARLQHVIDVVIRVLAWPYALMHLFGRPGSGYGYMGGALAVTILVLIWGISTLLGGHVAGRNP